LKRAPVLLGCVWVGVLALRGLELLHLADFLFSHLRTSPFTQVVWEGLTHPVLHTFVLMGFGVYLYVERQRARKNKLADAELIRTVPAIEPSRGLPSRTGPHRANPAISLPAADEFEEEIEIERIRIRRRRLQH